LNQPPVANEAISIAIEKHADMVRRICFLYLKNKEDVEDVFQDVFLKLFLCMDSFANDEHQKAWLCRVTFNKCKDLCKSSWHKRVVPLEEMEIPFASPEEGELVQSILALPLKHRELIYLHYYEGKTIPEIAEITQQNINTVYSQLKRAKARLKQKVEELS